LFVWEIGAAYGVGSIYYDAVIDSNIQQIQTNILRNTNPLNGVYNPTIGHYDY